MKKLNRMIVVTAFSACLCITLFSAPPKTRGWRGIVPPRSTRADVERLLGPPADSSNKFMSAYRLKDEDVLFQYESDRQCEPAGGWRVPSGTVVSITVTPKTRLPFTNLPFDTSSYKKTSGGHRAEDIVYTNEEEGVSITVFQGDVTTISYFPGAADSKLRCHDAPGGSGNTRSITGYPPLDSYHDISFEKEKSYLDNFAINLLEDTKAKGYIVVYRGRRMSIRAARIRATRAKKYLVRVRGVSSSRVITVDGGRLNEFLIELYVGESWKSKSKSGSSLRFCDSLGDCKLNLISNELVHLQ